MGGSSHPQGQQLAQNWLSWLEAGPGPCVLGLMTGEEGQVFHYTPGV